MPRIDGVKERFQDSVSKSLLRADVVRGIITEESDPKVVYASEDEHQLWVYKGWKEALERLLALVKQDRDRMRRDTLSYGHDLEIVQVSRPNTEVWHRSPAYRLLKKDIKEGNHSVPPMKLWLSKREYQAFDLDVFRKHIYQEVDSEPKRAFRFEKKRKQWKYPELHQDHPRMKNG